MAHIKRQILGCENCVLYRRTWVDGINFCRVSFLSHPLEGLRTMYDVHLKLIGKRVVDFLLVLIELRIGVTAEALW